MNTPERSSSGVTQFELRATALDPTLDLLLAACTMKQLRHELPGYLYLFSPQTYQHVVDDLIDGQSRKERRLASYRRQVADFHRNRFSLEPTVEKKRIDIQGNPTTVLEVHLQLGAEAARRFIAPPFFDQTTETTLPLYYQIPHPTRGLAAPQALDDLREYLESGPRGVIDELVVVQSSLRNRAFATRSRKRTLPDQKNEDAATVAPVNGATAA